MKRQASSALIQLLAHPATHDAMKSLAQGSDPRGVLAGFAGDLFAQKVAQIIGAKRVEKPKVKAEPVASSPGVKRRPKVEVVDEDDIVDAEFTVIDVTPRGAKKTG